MKKVIMKPQIQNFEKVESAEGFDIHEVMNYISEKYNFDCYDVYNSHKHFDTWCDSKGYGEIDPEGKRRSSSNIWFAEYNQDPKGMKLCPKYVNVLDWFVEKYMPDQTYNEFHITEKTFSGKKIPQHMKTFAQYLFTEFGENVTLVLSHED